MNLTATKTIFQKYPAYKDSGVEWLGKIPEHWEVQPGLRFIYENKSRNNGMKRNTVLSLSYGTIRVKQEQELTGLVPESFETYQLVEKGDLIFRPTDLQNDKVSLRSGISEFEGIITNAYLNFRFKSIANSKFYHYLFRAIDNNKLIYGLGSGLRQNIDFRDFRRFQFPFPSLPEQTAIANFLDDKTAKIEKAIAQKEKLISLLKERKQIIIQNAVTKGLDPNAKMKDSGVEWIGEIPEGWEVKRLKYFGYIYSGLSGKIGEDFAKEPKLDFKPFIPFTSIFRDKIINSSKHQFVKISRIEKQNMVKCNDILFLMSSETLEDVGKTSIYTGNEKQLYLNSFCKGFKTTSNNLLPIYLNELLSSDNYRNYFSIVGRGFTRINIKQDYILNIEVLIPPKSEQVSIIKHIETQSAKIDKAISLQEKQIEKLKEYKTVLIDAAVTGKIKVSCV